MNTTKNTYFCTLLFISTLFFSALSFAQEQKKGSLNSKNEIRLDIFQLLIMLGLEVSYERFIDDVSSWGVSGFLNFDPNFNEEYRYQNFELSLYYRLYFSPKTPSIKGFFAQPFFSLTQGEMEDYDYDRERYVEDDFLGISGGALIGFKWLNTKNYSFEVHAGAGRYFILDRDTSTDNTAYPRINFSIGKRF